MSARPLPVELMPACRTIEAEPPFVVGFTTIPAAHCFHDITRIGEEFNLTWFTKGLESNRCRDNLGLLICCHSQVLTDSTPDALVTQECNGRRATIDQTIAQARSVAIDLDLF